MTFATGFLRGLHRLEDSSTTIQADWEQVLDQTSLRYLEVDVCSLLKVDLRGFGVVGITMSFRA